ncbi:DUF2726 domain-containing protein [Cupriavidus sp. CP313]
MKALFALALMFALVFLALTILKAKTNGPGTAKGFEFARRTPFLRQDEIQLYIRLSAALKDAHVFPQVAMSAFVQHRGKSQAARNLFAQKYVDYLVCERNTMRPLYVIELDGASHRSAAAQRRDKQKNDVLASAGIPIKRYDSKDVDFTVILRDYATIATTPAQPKITPTTPSDGKLRAGGTST